MAGARRAPVLLGLALLMLAPASSQAMTGRNDRRFWRDAVIVGESDNATAGAPPPPPPPSNRPAVVAGAAVPAGGGEGRRGGAASLRFDPDPSHPRALAHGAFLDARHTKSNFGKLRLVLGSADAARQRRDGEAGGSDGEAGGGGGGDIGAKSARRRRPTPRPHHQDRAEVFASGWLEGWLTAERIYDHYFNMHRYFRVQLNASMDRPMDWLRRNDAWVRRRAAAAGLDDDDDGDQGEGGRAAPNGGGGGGVSDRQYWATVDLIVAQADGMAAGYAARSEDAARRARELCAAAATAAAGVGGGGGGDKAAAAAAAAAAASAKAAEAAAAAVPPLAADDLLFLNGNGDLYDVMDMFDAVDAGELPPPASFSGEGGEGEGGDGRDGKTMRRQIRRRDRRCGGSPTLGPWARRKFGLRAFDGKEDAGGGNTTANNHGGSGGGLRLARDLELAGHCSALVKVAADLSDVYFAHSTWDSYTAMTRLYKHLDWGSVAGPSAPLGAARVSHSGYPGEVASDDDFYVASSGLLVTEATLHIFDARALAPLVEQKGERVLSWARVRAATALATEGEGWVALLRREQSGTYNNAFLVVDLKRFVPAAVPAAAGVFSPASSSSSPASAAQGPPPSLPPGLHPGFLWLAEQLPGRLPARDLTPLVARARYAAAYNVPRDKQIYDAAGYPAMAAAARRLARRDRSYAMPSRLLSFKEAPRARLFRRDQGFVSSLRDAQRLMRGNAFATDPISDGFPVAAVCGRGDLIPRGDLAVPKGCYDTKVTSWRLAWGGEGLRGGPPLAAEVVGGPTLGGRLGAARGGAGRTPASGEDEKDDPADPADGPLPPFQWDPVRHRDFAHRGMHEGEYRFRFERQRAQDLPLPGDEEAQQRGRGGGGGGEGGDI